MKLFRWVFGRSESVVIPESPQDASGRNLEWLDDHRRRTTEELIKLQGEYRTDSLISQFREAIWRKADKEGEGRLSEEEQIILAIEAMEQEVNNGGYDQFFRNTPEYAAALVSSLRRIGCPETAEISQDAVNALSIGSDLVPEAIASTLALDNEARDDLLNECDRRYYQAPEDIAERLFEFIKANRARIVI